MHHPEDTSVPRSALRARRGVVTHGRRRRATTRALLAGAVLVAVTSAVNVGGARAIDDARTVPATVTEPTTSPPPSTTTTTTTTTTGSAPGPPYSVDDETITLFDPSRATPSRGDVPGHAGRQLVTVIRRPAGLSGPLPLVVFGHGWNSNPTVYESLLDAWAAAGYLVAAPTFPDSTDTLPGPPVSDYPEQARDISFVITSLLSGRAGPVDPTRIAVAGHSDGGTDVALMALDLADVDPRVRAYLSLSGEIPAGVPGPWTARTDGALFVAVGTDDEFGLLPRAVQVFDTAEVAPKVLLTVEGGDHLGMYVGTSAQAAAVRAETVRFLDAALGPGGATSGQLVRSLEPTGDPSLVVTTSCAGAPSC